MNKKLTTGVGQLIKITSSKITTGVCIRIRNIMPLLSFVGTSEQLLTYISFMQWNGNRSQENKL